MLEKLMGQLNKEFALDDTIKEIDEHDYQFAIENEQIEARELKRGYLLKGTIGERPMANGESFLLKVMEANLFGIGTRGAVIGLKENGKELTLSLELDYTISYKEFKERLEDFINVIDFWRNEALKHE